MPHSFTLAFLFSTLCFIAAWPSRAEPFDAHLDAQTTIPIERFVADGKTLLLWLPSEHGLQAAHATVGKALAARGVEVWTADVFAAGFVAPSTEALAAMDAQIIARLIEYAQTQTRKRLFLLSNDLGASLALSGARQWQADHPRSVALGGALLLSPNLLTRTPEAGQDAVYLQIAAATNLPVFVLQPALSVGHWRLRELTAQLERSGSTVYTRSLPQVRDRFFFRNDALREEIQMTQKLPALLDNALRLLSRDTRARTAPPLAASSQPPPVREEKQLREYRGDPQPWPLALPDLRSRKHTLAQYTGKVVLVNFWASWCPPCVHEMPSMQQLEHQLREQPFKILAVNMAEPKTKAEAFMRQHQLNFTVLLDDDGAALRQWKVMAFPTSFVLDKKGRIRYAVFGAMDWMDADAVGKIGALIAEE